MSLKRHPFFKEIIMATAYQNLSEYDFDSVPNGAGKKFGIVVAEWNKNITEKLLEGACNTLERHGVKAEEAFRVSALHIKIGVQHSRRPEQRQQTREDFARAVQPENQRQVVHHRKQHRAVSVSPENLKRGQHRGRGDHCKQKDLLQPA